MTASPTAEMTRPPDRGWRHHLRHQTGWSRSVLLSSLAVNVFFFAGAIAVLTSHGWSRVCPEGTTRIECSPSDPLAVGLQSNGLRIVLAISLVAGLLVAVTGLFTYRRMPTKSAREAVINAAVLATQPILLAALLLWFRGTDVDRFARNFLNISLIGQKAGIAWKDFTAEFGSIVRLALVWAVVAGALTAGYAYLQLGRKPVIIAVTSGGPPDSSGA